MTLLFLYIAAINVAIVSIVVLLWWAHLRFWRWRLEGTPADYAHLELLTLPDGGMIELRRVGAPTDAGPQGKTSQVPVLLLHGLAMNHRNHDTAEDVSFARHLHKQGRDVWLLTLRSGRSGMSLVGPKHSTFAAMVQHDLPCAVNAVLAHTGEAQVDLVGFSMGGMLLYASLDRTLDSRLVRRAALFASPAKIRPLGPLAWSRFLPAAVAPSVQLGLLTRSFAFAPRWVCHLLWGRLYNPSNVERAVERSMLWNVWATIPGRLGADFVRWSAQQGEVTVDGKPVLAGLANVTIPACFFAGAADWLAPVWSVRAGFDAWGSSLPNADKHFVVLGREHGLRDDYGHCDISFGRNVREDVFEPAARFLASGTYSSARTQTPTQTSRVASAAE